MAQSLDLELKKAFRELQTKMLNTRTRIQEIDMQLKALSDILKYVKFAQQEASTWPLDMKTYEPVGRAFMLIDLSEVKTVLNEREIEIETRRAEWEHNKYDLEKNLRESEDNIRDMVQQRKDLREN